MLATLNKLNPGFAVSDARPGHAQVRHRSISSASISTRRATSAHDPDAPARAPEPRINPDAVKAHNGPVRPEALHDLLLYIRDEYGDPPIMITENGAGFGDRDEVMGDGIVNDPLRADYIRRHIEAMLRGARRGRQRHRLHGLVPVRQFRVVARL